MELQTLKERTQPRSESHRLHVLGINTVSHMAWRADQKIPRSGNYFALPQLAQGTRLIC